MSNRCVCTPIDRDVLPQPLHIRRCYVRMIDAQLFMYFRSRYDKRHADDLSINAHAMGLPFCDACCDWHYKDEPCSEI